MGVSPSHWKKFSCLYSLNRTLVMHDFRYLSTLKEDVGTKKTTTDDRVEKPLKERIFNTVLFEHDPEVSFVKRKFLEKKMKTIQTADMMTKSTTSARPLTLKLLHECAEPAINENNEVIETEDQPPTYPYAERIVGNNHPDKKIKDANFTHRNKMLAKFAERRKGMKKWMSDYDLFTEDSQDYNSVSSDINYGSSDPKEPVSNVPCGGCGALLHCQDYSIPGYLPKELFAKRSIKELKSLICQRCHFLKEFNVALDVSVSPEEYPKILSCIQDKRALAILMVDMLDFPCSIWPGIIDIIGNKRPVIIVGNKIDLIPGDQKGYLDHWRETLLTYVYKMGFDKSNIKHVALVSAHTGFGVEDLITQLHELWEYKSDVFLIGCTNVGKSTLFNRLLQSDFCKTQAINLVQRATTSIWPGTTLNLLKFPVLRPEGWRLTMRKKRLLSEKYKIEKEKQLQREQFKRQRMYHMPSLMQYVGNTFTHKIDEQSDIYSIGHEEEALIGIDENDYEFAKGRWCYDTPGVMHPDQILNILTTEELVKVIPKAAILPRFFILKPGRSLFLAGLGRIDLLSASFNNSVRIAVFSSIHLPVSIVQTEEAEDVYKQLLGSELLAVPCGGPQRLADWPGLQAKEEPIEVKGLGWKECCADIILSSAGWVSVSGCDDMSFRVWTPFARGIHLRQPALLPHSVNFRGARISHTPTYKPGRAAGKYEKRRKY
ncbi:nitric oxide-associated protein 1 isoform X2 [Thrips palmi]|nr:nitric oxide-associated protein 1 isoform X2 [Thrips palmi]